MPATEVTDPDEYARLYALAEQVYAGYGDYRVKTVAIGCKIPVFRLNPLSWKIMATFALVHGAWHGPWCWELLTPLLQQACHSVVAPELPTDAAGVSLRVWP